MREPAHGQLDVSNMARVATDKEGDLRTYLRWADYTAALIFFYLAAPGYFAAIKGEINWDAQIVTSMIVLTWLALAVFRPQK